MRKAVSGQNILDLWCFGSKFTSREGIFCIKLPEIDRVPFPSPKLGHVQHRCQGPFEKEKSLTFVDLSVLIVSVLIASMSAHISPRQIVGVSFTPDLAKEFKAEAAKRGVHLKTLFLELWALGPVESHATRENIPVLVGQREIVGLSLSPALAKDFKQQAARRGVTLVTIFAELWDVYKRSRTGKK
jgi:hypothetical protein